MTIKKSQLSDCHKIYFGELWLAGVYKQHLKMVLSCSSNGLHLYHWKDRLLWTLCMSECYKHYWNSQSSSQARQTLIRVCLCCHGAHPFDTSHPSNGGTGSGERDKNLASVEWTSKLITLPVWEPCAPESGKRKMGLKWWIKDEWGSPGFRLRLIRRRIAVLSSMAEQWRPACEVSAWCFSASSRGNESHYCQCGVSFMAQLD